MRTYYYDPSFRAIVRLWRHTHLVAIGLVVAAAPVRLNAQTADSLQLSTNYWQKLVSGAVTSILLHEAGHIVTSYAVGGHPTFGFNELRPTIYSGIVLEQAPRKQFLFSAAGLTVQSVLDEGILDIPHHRGSAFERGLLAGGIGTTLFYLTLGRRGSVSDVDFMARSHVLNVTQVTLIFGGVAAMHTFRISRDGHYANFFARPRADKGLDVGMSLGLP